MEINKGDWFIFKNNITPYVSLTANTLMQITDNQFDPEGLIHVTFYPENETSVILDLYREEIMAQKRITKKELRFAKLLGLSHD